MNKNSWFFIATLLVVAACSTQPGIQPSPLPTDVRSNPTLQLTRVPVPSLVFTPHVGARGSPAPTTFAKYINFVLEVSSSPPPSVDPFPSDFGINTVLLIESFEKIGMIFGEEYMDKWGHTVRVGVLFRREDSFDLGMVMFLRVEEQLTYESTLEIFLPEEYAYYETDIYWKYIYRFHSYVAGWNPDDEIEQVIRSVWDEELASGSILIREIHFQGIEPVDDEVYCVGNDKDTLSHIDFKVKNLDQDFYSVVVSEYSYLVPSEGCANQ